MPHAAPPIHAEPATRLGATLIAWIRRRSLADAQASGEPNAEQRARGAANAVPSWIILVEGWGDEAPFIALVRSQCAPEAMEALGAAGPFDLDIYRHQITVAQAP